MIEIPNKKYFMIGEVARMCDVKTHVLRYWEGQFPQLKPSKRRGRRYYQREDVLLILEINDLLNHKGFTVSGAVAQLNQKKSHKNTDATEKVIVSDNSAAQSELALENPKVTIQQDVDLLGLVGSLKTLKKACQNFQDKVRQEL